MVSTMNLFSMLGDELKRAFDITHLDYGFLTLLSGTPGGRRMSDLAQIFGVDPSVVTYRIGRMEDRDLASRVVCPTDGRGVLAVITEEGQHLVEKAAAIHVETVRTLFLDHIDPAHYEALAASFSQIRRSQVPAG